MRKVQEMTKQRSSASSTRGVIEGETAVKGPSLLVDTEAANKWYSKLIKSLRMVYLHDGKWKQSHEVKKGDKVVAHPEFDPEVVEAMDKELPKPLANYVYKQAFNASKPKADAMLKKFEESQSVVNRPAFQNAIKRFSVFAPEAAEEIESKMIIGNPNKKNGGTRRVKKHGKKRTTRKQLGSY